MFYDRFKAICAEKKVSMSSVLDKAGLSRGNLARWKSGIEPKHDTLQKIAFALDVHLSYLTSSDDRDMPNIGLISSTVPSEELEKIFQRVLSAITPQKNHSDLEEKIKDAINESSRTIFFYSSADEQTKAHLDKYTALNKAGRAQVDSYTDYIASNPANLKAPDEEE